MGTRKVGSITPLWNQAMFIRPHFSMLSSLDKSVVMLQNGPLGDYSVQHGYPDTEDNSGDILKDMGVETHRSTFFGKREFGADLFNEILPLVQDMDIVFKLDPDMFFTKEDWNGLVEFIRNTDFDCYRMDFSAGSINYYGTGDFDHGLKDAKENDIIAFSPKKYLTGVLGYPTDNQAIIPKRYTCHHFRGWNKSSINISTMSGEWISAPEEIRRML